MDDPPGPLKWRKTPWGPYQHAFRWFGELFSEAVCKHSARTRLLTEAPAPQCPGCLVIVGTEMEERGHHERDRWAM